MRWQAQGAGSHFGPQDPTGLTTNLVCWAAMFNPHPRLETLRFTDQVACHVMDDVLQDPDAWVRYAAERASQFRPPASPGYPRISLAPPPDMSTATERFVNQHLRRLFEARRTLRAGCRLSMVTTPESQLLPYQMICHHDAMTHSNRESIQACVLYLFHDAALGGTSFYVPAGPIAEIVQLFADCTARPADAERFFCLPAAAGVRRRRMTDQSSLIQAP